MKIKREKGYDEITFLFRLISLSEQEIEIIKNQIEGKIKYEIYYENRNMIFYLKSMKDVKHSIRLSNQFLKVEQDVYISILSSYDHGGATVPNFVTFLINEIKCKVQISYVVC